MRGQAIGVIGRARIGNRRGRGIGRVIGAVSFYTLPLALGGCSCLLLAQSRFWFGILPLTPKLVTTMGRLSGSAYAV